MFGLNCSWIDITYPGGISDLPTPRGFGLNFFLGSSDMANPSRNCCWFYECLRRHGCSDSRGVFIRNVGAVVQERTFRRGEVCKALEHVERM